MQFWPFGVDYYRYFNVTASTKFDLLESCRSSQLFDDDDTHGTMSAFDREI